MSDALERAYTERARLVAFLARMYPSCTWVDPAEPDFPVVYIDTPVGQLSWHIAVSDFRELFFGRIAPAVYENPWDGHSTEEKYERLAKLPLLRWSMFD